MTDAAEASGEAWTVRRVLGWAADDLRARGGESPRLEAELLLAFVLATDRIGLVLHHDRPLSRDELAAYKALHVRRRAGEPVAYLRGMREFYGRPFRVDRRVLVPRPETELLVEVGLARSSHVSLAARVLDLCTGSGCVAITLAKERPTNAVLGTDISAEAIEVARENAQRLGALPAVSFRTSDLFADLGEGAGPFDLVTANPPYIPETDRATLPVTITGFEPHVALFGGQDGLDVTARIVEETPLHLAAGGVLAMELGEGQPPGVAERMRARGFEDVEIRRDYAGIERIVSGRWVGEGGRVGADVEGAFLSVFSVFRSAPMFPVQLLDVALFGARHRHGEMCMHAIIDVRRSFTREQLERALAATIEAFPVLGCRYEPGFWRDRWARVAGPVAAAVHHEEGGDLEARSSFWVQRSPVSTEERPVRLVGLVEGGRSRLILSLLHLAVDGAGVAAVGHVLGAHLMGVPCALPVEPRRDLGAALGGLRWYHLPALAKGLAHAAARPVQHFAAARRARAYPATPGAGVSTRLVVITESQLRELRARCASATVNDILVAALARASAGRSSGGPVVVTYTMDLRRYGTSPRLMASNSSGLLSAIVTRSSLGDLAGAALAVARITKGQREVLAGPASLLGPLALAAPIPHAVTRRLAPYVGPLLVDLPVDRGLVVTNVGRLDDGLRAFGDDLLAIRIVGPFLGGVPIPLIVAFGFRGELHLQLLGGPDLGEAVLEALEGEILEALGIGRP